MKMRLWLKISLVFIGIAAAGIAGYGWYAGSDLPQDDARSAIPPASKAPTEVASFTDCAAAGYPILESYPAQCRTPDGRIYTEDIGNALLLYDEIRIATPLPNSVIENPLSVGGEARGSWFFEATLPVELRDGSGALILEGYVTAESEWATAAFVPFSGTLSFAPPATDNGTLILRKANPSGLPEYDASLRIPVRFR